MYIYNISREQLSAFFDCLLIPEFGIPTNSFLAPGSPVHRLETIYELVERAEDVKCTKEQVRNNKKQRNVSATQEAKYIR